MKSCAIPECRRSYYAKGLCEMHWIRGRKGQSLTAKSQYEKTEQERFAEKYTVQPNGCWHWNSSRSSNPRANLFYFRGRPITAYRASYIMFVGEIPDGMLVCHSCDNGLCVNPQHLWVGTYSDNNRDTVRKQRRPTRNGAAINGAKLIEQDVRQIRSSQESARSLARRYGVSHSTVQDVLRRKTWAHVS